MNTLIKCGIIIGIAIPFSAMAQVSPATAASISLIPVEEKATIPQPLPPGEKGALNPQPLPPGAKVTLNPQPLPPKDKGSLNPQPLPPGAKGSLNPQPLPPGAKVTLNPQPLPPGSAANVIKVVPGMTLEQVLTNSDATIIVSPDGKRITVGQLRSRAQAVKNQSTAKPTMVKSATIANKGGKRQAMLAVLQKQAQGYAQEKLTFQPAKTGVVTTPMGTPHKPYDPAKGRAIKVDTSPHISTINGNPGSVVFTPEAGFNSYAIRGFGWGNQAKMVRIKSDQIPGSWFFLKIISSDSTHIVAELNPNLSNYLDADNVTLVVDGNSGEVVSKGGNSFYAAREKMVLPHVPDNLKIRAIPANDDYFPDLTDKTATLYVSRGPLTNGNDFYLLQNLNFTKGFETTDFVFFHEQLGISGFEGCDTYLAWGKYDANWDGDNIRVDWGVNHCHYSPILFFADAFDTNSSRYVLRVNVEGPRGVSMFKK